MAPKRKKKTGKLTKMTDEERAIFLEQQRVAEEELKTKKMALLTQYLQDKLNHEEKFTKLNKAKLTHYWRTIMRETKSKELKRTIEILSQTFERIMDRKESIIKTLVADLSEADEQHLMALRSHLQNVDILIDLQNQRLHKLKTDYEKELHSLVEEFLKEENFTKQQHDKQVNDLKDIFVALDSTYTAKAHEAVIDQTSLKDDLKNKILKRCLPLEMFWKRFNKVQLDRLAIIKEYNMLEQENIQLKLLLKQYLDGISVNSEVISGDNSLIVINGRSNLKHMSIIDDPRIRLISTDDDSVQPKGMINYATTPAAVDYRIRQTT
ncbi:uncharacterized protein DC041_0008398 [Schistosoma bovis]|uniref:Dynein regulatory complex subunit 2 n=1 Tax=Schistosoma bovis TaxID=6184 RepID=A0A430QN39_SCHBO|nr:uncharacterized protein DC041_0008398 [Schistosoma bovis]